MMVEASRSCPAGVAGAPAKDDAIEEFFTAKSLNIGPAR